PIDISGEWNPNPFHEDSVERGGGPELGDYTGIPLSEAARAEADAWDASRLELPAWQCRPHPADYIARGPSHLKIWKEWNPSTRRDIAYHLNYYRSIDRLVYLDGRPHPPEYARHTWDGFS